jgi:hypothetical protein
MEKGFCYVVSNDVPSLEYLLQMHLSCINNSKRRIYTKLVDFPYDEEYMPDDNYDEIVAEMRERADKQRA